MRKRQDLFKKVKVVTDGEGSPISVKNQLFVSSGDIRAAEKLMDDVVKTVGVEKHNLRIKPFFLISEKNAKKLCVVKKKVRKAKKAKKTKKK